MARSVHAPDIHALCRVVRTKTVVNASVGSDPVLNQDCVVGIFAGIAVAEGLVEYVLFSLHECQLELFLATCQ
jgi:phage host-nuclease inhibitor protein Gam